MEHLDLVPCDDTGSEMILCEILCEVAARFFPKEADGSDNLFPFAFYLKKIPFACARGTAALPYLGPAGCTSDRS